MDIKQIPKNEGYSVEFKSFFSGVSPKELSITICAFANSEGGKVYIGVSDIGEPKGISISPKTLDDVLNAAREGCIPPVQIGLNQIPIDQNKEVLIISIEKSDRLHTTSQGIAYQRIGTQDKRVVGDELLRLAESKSQISFEDELLSVGVEVIDNSALDFYYNARRAISAISHSLSSSELLKKMNLAKQDNGNIKIRAGAFILFGKSEEEILLQRDFTFVRYESDSGLYSTREDIRLPANLLINRLLELIRPFNRKTFGFKEALREERELYPVSALREAIVNAIAHRDYRITGLRNEFRMYSDRIEIISPGGLPGPISLETLGTRHYSRNPKITHALLIMGFMEELGQGINLIKQSLKINGNPPPEFKIHQDQFIVVMRPKISLDALDDPIKILNDYFKSHTYITRSQLEALCNLKATKSKILINKFINEGFLTKVGSGPQTKYKRSA